MSKQQSGAEKEPAPKNLYSVLAGFYIIPLLLYSFYSLKTMPGAAAWGIFAFGLMVTTLGGANLLLQLRRWEFHMRNRVQTLIEQKSPVQATHVIETRDAPLSTPEASDENEDQIGQLAKELLGRDEAIQSLQQELEELRQRSQNLDEQVRNSHQQSNQKDTVLADYQQTISEQRSIIDKKQQYISRLEAKVQDLNYEVKTLLQLGELGVSGGRTHTREMNADSSHPAINVFQTTATENPDLDAMVQSLPASSEKKVNTHYDAAVQLQKCIEQATKLTGASHLGGESSRFLDLSVDSYAIDLRRLFDSFRNESSCTVMLYSPNENRMLFVNNQVKGLLGWSPEKFVKDYAGLISSSTAEWKHALKQIDQSGETQTRLLIRNRNSEDVPLHCYLGKIPSGAFSNQVIGILYPA